MSFSSTATSPPVYRRLPSNREDTQPTTTSSNSNCNSSSTTITTTSNGSTDHVPVNTNGSSTQGATQQRADSMRDSILGQKQEEKRCCGDCTSDQLEQCALDESSSLTCTANAVLVQTFDADELARRYERQRTRSKDFQRSSARWSRILESIASIAS